MPEEADVVNVHAGALIETNRPLVQSCHGYYWTGDFVWYDEYWRYNNLVIETSRRAHAIITPSEWIAYPIRKDMRHSPIVIPHGVDIDQFKPSKTTGNFVLWAKPRVDVVSDPAPVNELAQRAKNIRFITTFGIAAQNVDVIGTLPHHRFLETMSKAAVWLATTRETGDIASREAMAMAIPVLGWNHGATAELVIHRETGYLAKVDDYDDLREGLQYCLSNRGRLGKAGRELVKEKYQWRDLMGQYAKVFRDVYEADQYPVKISVIVPAYNYAHFLVDCLESLSKQTMNDFEVIVVNDASTDNTANVALRLGDALNLDLTLINHPENRGLVGALNTGRVAAKGRYLVNLDADNTLAPEALEVMSIALDERHWLDVASGGLGHLLADGSYRQATDWPFGIIDIHGQLKHINQLHSSSMMRARSAKRIGGYRTRMRRNEDGEYWCRAMSAGLRFEQVTGDPTLNYRWHEKNKSKMEGGEHDPEGPLSWNFYFPHKSNTNLMPFGATGSPPKGSWAVRSYAKPHIAVVIPCGPNHSRLLVDALDSVAGQTYQNIECIVCNDTGKPLDVAAMGHPWVKVVNGPRMGPGAARNAAIAAARAPLIVPLDADDMLYPDAIRTMYLAWLDWPEGLVYMDCYTEDKPGKRTYYHSGDWSWHKIVEQAIYQVTILYPRQWWRAVGGYPVPGDEIALDMGWEDWLFGVKLHLAGRDATYVKQPWGVYRHWTGYGQNRKDNEGYGTDEFQEKLQRYYKWIESKEEEMRGCCGGRRAQGRSGNSPGHTILRTPEMEGELRVVYRGDRAGGFGLNSRAVRGKKYQVWPNEPFTVDGGDGWILNMGGFERAGDDYASMDGEPPLEPPGIPPIDIQGEPQLYPEAPIERPVPMPTGAPEIISQDSEYEPQNHASTITEMVASGQLGLSPLDNGRTMSMLPSVDIAELQSLTEPIVARLKSIGIVTVGDLAYDFEQNKGLRISNVKGIGPTRLEKIENEIFE